MTNIYEIYDLLDANNPHNIQENGIEEGLKIKCIDAFIQPMFKNYSKNIWENCARIIEKKSDAELKPYLIMLCSWTQDLNWPGAYIILQRLKMFSASEIKIPLEECIKLAIKTSDNEWLDYLSGLLANEEIGSILDKDLYFHLKSRYIVFWRQKVDDE